MMSLWTLFSFFRVADQSEMYAAEEQYDKKIYWKDEDGDSSLLVKAYSLNEHICSRHCTVQKAVCLSQYIGNGG